MKIVLKYIGAFLIYTVNGFEGDFDNTLASNNKLSFFWGVVLISTFMLFIIAISTLDICLLLKCPS